MLRPEGTSGDATSLTGPLTYISFLQLGPQAPAAFCCHCGKGLEKNEAVTCCKTERKAWCLIQCHPKTMCLSFPNGEQDPHQFRKPVSSEAALYRSTPISQWRTCYQQNLANCPLLEWQSVLFTSFDYFKCYLSNSVRRHLTGHLL